MPKPADLEAQLAQQLRMVQAQAAALVGAVSKGALQIFVAMSSVTDVSIVDTCPVWVDSMSRKAHSRTRFPGCITT